MTITPELKDKFLKLFLDDKLIEKSLRIDLNALLNNLSVDFDTLNAILSSLRDDSFITEGYPRRNTPEFICVIKQSAIDFMQHGGYTLKEQSFLLTQERLKLEVQKLQLELQTLKKEFPQNTTIERIISLVANIASVIGLVKH